jgi:hypothetical protein
MEERNEGCGRLPALKSQVPLVLATGLVGLVFTWLLTHGTWRLWEQEPYGVFYDALAQSLLEGRLDVPVEAVGGEYFTYQGKYYGYWGITPAVLRLPVAVWWPAMSGNWSRTSHLLACLLTLLASFGILRALQRHSGAEGPSPARAAAYFFFVLLVGLGSTMTFLAGRAFIYHEASIWAGAFALAYYWLILRYLLRPRLGWLLAALLCSVLCVQARATVGLGPIVTGALLAGVLLLLSWRGRRSPVSAEGWWQGAWRWLGVAAVPRPFVHALVLGAGVAASLGSYVLCNYLKFGTILDGVPLRYTKLYIEHPEILEQFGGKLLQLDNVRINAAAYLGRCAIATHPTFPWLKFAQVTILQGGEKHLGAEPFTSLPSCMPAFCLLALLGLAGLVLARPAGARAAVLPAVGALAGGAYLFFMYYVTQRYAHDLFPFLVISAAVGLHWVLSWRKPVLRWPSLAVLVPLALAGVYVNCAAALFYQREQIWGVPEERRAEFREMGRQIQAFVDTCLSKEGLLLTAHRCLHPHLWGTAPRTGDPVTQARLLAPAAAGWQTLADNADAARADSAWRARHPAGPPPAQPRCLFPFPFSMEPRPERLGLMVIPVAAGRRYLLSLPVHTQNYHGQLRLEGSFLHSTFPLPPTTPGLQVLNVPLRVTEPETKEVTVYLEGSSLVPSAKSSIWVSPPTLSRFTADDLPIQVCAGRHYTAHVHADRLCYLETHHRFLPGYRARVNGKRVEVGCSPTGHVLVPLPTGDNEVSVRFAGSGKLRLVLLGLGTTLALLACAGVWLGRRFCRRGLVSR